MKKHLFGMALCLCLVTSGAAIAQTIDDIQYYDPLDGTPLPGQDPLGWNADLLNQIVTVQGVLVEFKQYSSGSFHVVGPTGGVAGYSTSLAGYSLGDEVEVTGTVGLFRDQIQLSGTVTMSTLSTGNTVTPTALTIGEILSDYEIVGSLAYTEGTVTEVNASNFFMEDSGDTILVYIDSTTGIDISAVAVGDVYGVTSPVTVDYGLIEMKPVLQGDLVENPGGDTLPVISGVNNDNWIPEAADPMMISATITDDNAVSSASLYYRDSDGVTPGSWGSVPMANQGGNIWAGTVPGGHTGSQVDFYIEATDSGAQTVTLPGAAPATVLTVAVGFTKIYDACYAHPDSLSQSAAMDGQFVNIQGIVTAGTNHVGSLTKFIVQEPDVNPATGDRGFSGILVYETTAKYEYYQGDEVAIGGQIDEYFGLTEMIPHNGDAVYLIGFGNELPGPAKVTTRTLSDDSAADVDGDGIMGEAWESVWVQTYPAAVMDTLGFGEYIIADNSARNDSLVVNPLIELSYTGTIGDVIQITSYMDYAFSQRMIVPVADEYIIQTGLTAVDDTPTIQPAGGFHSVSPNPFNPQVSIKFVTNKANLVQLNVYNIRGEKVRTIVQDRLPANTYDFMWDGTNDAGQNVASGTYYARLRIGAEVVQVRPMTLLK